MEDLVESILDYVRSDYTDYAIMINGEWGVGKTHFWNNKIRKKIETGKSAGVPERSLRFSFIRFELCEIIRSLEEFHK